MDILSYNFLSDFFLIALKWIYTLLNDYSVAIIVLTILLRAVMLPLDLRQRKNTTKMSQLQPELESMKKRYANNPQQMQKKQQELYKEAGVKPLAGCLPMLLQMLIFFAFFGAMRIMSTEMQVALFLNAQHSVQSVAIPSWLWVHNFWQPDSGLAPVLPTVTDFSSLIMQNIKTISPETLSILQQKGLILFNQANGLFQVNNVNYEALTAGMMKANNISGVMNGWFILPVIAGGSLFLQQKLSAAGGQMPQQQQMKFMLWFFPLFSIWICASSNVAFAIYWLASNVYAIGQQLIINYAISNKNKKKLIVKEGTKP